MEEFGTQCARVRRRNRTAELAPSTLVQKLRFRWPHAQIVWYATDSMIAFALRDSFGP